MPSDTNPLPAAQLLALADAMANAVGSHVICDAWLEGSHMERTLEAYRAARAASPVTLEDSVLIEYHRARKALDKMKEAGLCPDNCDMAIHGRWIQALNAVENYARRLAGEGGE